MKRLPAQPEVLTHEALGNPLQVRSLDRMRNVTPGSEADPPPPRRCIHGFLGCTFGPAHVHGGRGRASGVISPACSTCQFGKGPYDEQTGECWVCRNRRELDEEMAR